jgi:hypothetical protein
MSNTVFYPYDITIHEGTTYDKWFKWSVDNVMQDLTGIVGLMQVRSKTTDELPLIDLPFIATPWEADGTSGIYLTDVGGDDAWQIYINNADTSGICETHKDIIGVYNLFLYNSDDECVLKQYGTANIVAAVARPDPII